MTLHIFILRTEEIEGGLEELKTKEEILQVIDKDVVVMNMLLDGSLPDDMKQDGELIAWISGTKYIYTAKYTNHIIWIVHFT